jgi:hypothetical protein
MMTRKPTDSEVQAVMQETGMERLQAYRHLQQRAQIQADLQRNPPPYSMGKSWYDSGDTPSGDPHDTINS